MRLVANGNVQIHAMQAGEPDQAPQEFDIPKEAADIGMSRHFEQLCEIWLIRVN
jgi:hypothetical protein